MSAKMFQFPEARFVPSPAHEGVWQSLSVMKAEVLASRQTNDPNALRAILDDIAEEIDIAMTAIMRADR